VRVLEQILLWWTVLSVVAGVIVARAFAMNERELVPLRTRHEAPIPADSRHTAV
jgi:hypothetical protein